MVDFTKPDDLTHYDQTISIFNEKIAALAAMDFSGHINLYENTIQFNHTSKQFERWTFSGWETLEINVANLPASGVQSISLDTVTKNSSGASINGTTLYLQTADSTFPGFVSITNQTFAGVKDFAGGLKTNSIDTRSASDSLLLKTNNTTRITLLSTGQVGIGTETPPTLFSVGGSLHVSGTQTNNSTEGGYLEWNRLSSTKKTYLINRSSTNGGFVLASVLDNNTLAEHMDVSYTNGVASGATSTIFGKAVVQKFGDSKEHYEFELGDTANTLSTRTDVANAKPFILNVTSTTANTTPTGGSLQFDLRILNQSALNVSSSRKVGVNTAASTSWVTIQGETVNSNVAALDVKGSSAGRIGLYPSLTASSYLSMAQDGDAAILSLGGSVGSGSLLLGVWSNQTAGIKIVGSTGFVGVGTNTPSTKLHVASAGANGGAGLFESTDNSNSLTIKGANSTSYITSASAILTDGTNSASLQLSTQNYREQGALRVLMGTSEAIFVRTNGNVGLGNIDPQARLHVHNTPASGGTVVEAARLSTSQSTANSGTSLGFYHGTSTLTASIYTKVASAGNVGDLFIQVGGLDRLIVKNTGAVEMSGALTVGSLTTNGNLSANALSVSTTATITGRITTNENMWIQNRGGIVLRGNETTAPTGQESVYLVTSTGGSAGRSFYILLAPNNAPTTITTHRPFAIDLGNGKVSMANGVSISVPSTDSTTALSVSRSNAGTSLYVSAPQTGVGAVALSVAGATTLTRNTTLSTEPALMVVGPTTLSSVVGDALSVSGTTSLSSTLAVAGTSAFQNTLTISNTNSLNGRLVITNPTPTISLRATANVSGFIHCADNNLYIIAGSGTNGLTWEQPSSTPETGLWPLKINLSSADSTEFYSAVFGGHVCVQRAYNVTSQQGGSLRILSNGRLARDGSSLKYKKDIEPLENSYADNVLDNLRPVWYRSNTTTTDRQDWSWFGLIAEEVAQVEPRLVQWGISTAEDGAELLSPDGVNYDRISAILLNIVKRQKQKLEDLEERLASLEAKMSSNQ